MFDSRKLAGQNRSLAAMNRHLDKILAKSRAANNLLGTSAAAQAAVTGGSVAPRAPRGSRGFRGPTPYGYIGHSSLIPLLAAYQGASALGYGAEFLSERRYKEYIAKASPREKKLLADQVGKLGTQTTFSVKDIQHIQTRFAKAGFTPREILGATPAATYLSIATGATPHQGVETLASFARQFQLKPHELGLAADQLAYTTLQSKQDLPDVFGYTKRAAQLLSLIHISEPTRPY